MTSVVTQIVKFRLSMLVAAFGVIMTLSGSTCCSAASSKPLLMTHYMPWFTAKPFSAAWGFHWTMTHYNPDHVVNGRPDAASYYRPLIGLYDSDDPDVVRCQVMLMKMAGIDGVVIDWYGNDDFNDFGVNNRNTLVMAKAIADAGMHYAVCYEDTTVPKEITGGVIPQDGAVAHGQKLMQWMQTNMFSSSAYFKINGRPVLLVFGQPYYSDTQWSEIFSSMPNKPLLLTEIRNQDPISALGAFDWPLPHDGTLGGLAKQQDFVDRVPTFPVAAACAFPRFNDYYAVAGVGQSWGHIDDQDGKTYTSTLTNAIKSKPTFVQLVTWNDYGEGTQIEPTVEFGCRDLIATQRIKKQMIDPAFRYTADDLQFPLTWFKLKKEHQSDAAISKKLDAIYEIAVSGKVRHAEAELKAYEAQVK